MKYFYRVHVIFNQILENKLLNLQENASRFMPGMVYADEKEILGIAYRRAELAFWPMEDSKKFQTYNEMIQSGIKKVRVFRIHRMDQFLPIPKWGNLCINCRHEKECTAMCKHQS